jgi:chromosome segregation ATPase
MGESAEDKVKDWAKGEIGQFQDAYNQNMAQFRAGADQLERLKSAKNKIQKAVDELGSFRNHVNSIHSSLSQSQYKGSRRSKLDSKFQTLMQGLDGDKTQHQLNLNELNLKISSLELQQSGLGQGIAEIQSTLDGLFAML